MREEARRLVAEAAKEAFLAERPDPATVRMHLLELPEVTPEEVFGRGRSRPPGPYRKTPVVALGEAIRLALHEAMGCDVRVRVFGEDVADAPEELLDELEGKGGVFGTTFGLQRRFGSDRCYNTPLAEANIVGRAVGQAMRGLRPVPEVQFFDYIWTAMQQIKSEAATVRWRSAGDWSCPMVLGCRSAGTWQAGRSGIRSQACRFSPRYLGW